MEVNSMTYEIIREFDLPCRDRDIESYQGHLRKFEGVDNNNSSSGRRDGQTSVKGKYTRSAAGDIIQVAIPVTQQLNRT